MLEFIEGEIKNFLIAIIIIATNLEMISRELIRKPVARCSVTHRHANASSVANTRALEEVTSSTGESIHTST